MQNFKLGEVVYHKATHNRAVIVGIDGNELTCVDQNGEKLFHCIPEEFFTEEEWEQKYG